VTVPSVLIAAVAFVAMEPITALTHRFVMHGVGRALHRSHHRPNAAGWELNDLYPLVFAVIVMMAMAIGFNVAGFAWLVPIGVGVTIYGACYALVHDVYIHRRLGWFGDRRIAVLERLRSAHRVHHERNSGPYGMLLPIVPRGQRSSPGG
jgi:beta-carotene 3-hydroxylase